MHIFIDIETTGLDPNTCRVVQVAWATYSNLGTLEAKRDFIVKPEGYSIPAESTKIHGITNEFAIAVGKSIQKVLVELTKDIKKSATIVAHNAKYDLNVLINEFSRNNLGNPFSELILNSTTHKCIICTMISTLDYCAIPHAKFGKKYPSLTELYNKLFKSDFAEKHNARGDLEATVKCFWELKRLKLVNFTPIPYNDWFYETPQNKVTDTRITKNTLPEPSTVGRGNNTAKAITSNHKHMELKNQVISLKGFIEALMCNDQISQNQLEKLKHKLDDLLTAIDNEDFEQEVEVARVHQSSTSVQTLQNISSNLVDDLPF
jgi:DNA polymerase-3 subunit epsilon